MPRIKLGKHDVTKDSTHLLLWNLQALRNNAAYEPVESIRRKSKEVHDTWAPPMEAELKRRGISVPEGPETSQNREQWEALLAAAVEGALRHRHEVQ